MPRGRFGRKSGRRSRNIVSRWFYGHGKGRYFGRNWIGGMHGRGGRGTRFLWLNRMQGTQLYPSGTQQEETLQNVEEIEETKSPEKPMEGSIGNATMSTNQNTQGFTRNTDDLLRYYYSKRSNMKLFWVAVSIAVAAFLIVLVLNQLNIYKLPL
ncbi:MAG: hypothetical protein ACP6IP_06670 [Candidatus Njordarchaeia archaeon]